jgi:hypothetical protein
MEPSIFLIHPHLYPLVHDIRGAQDGVLGVSLDKACSFTASPFVCHGRPEHF